MRITDEQKERANLVNLPQFLMSHGFDLKKVGNTGRMEKNYE